MAFLGRRQPFKPHLSKLPAVALPPPPPLPTPTSPTFQQNFPVPQFNHPAVWMHVRPIMHTWNPPLPVSPQHGQVMMPPVMFSPVYGPWNHAFLPHQRIASPVIAPAPPPPPPQVMMPPFRGGPMGGPWNRHGAQLPGGNTPPPPIPPPPPPPPPIPTIYAPVYRGGPLRGPWRIGPYMPPTPMLPPPLVPPPPPPPTNPVKLPFVPRLRKPVMAAEQPGSIGRGQPKKSQGGQTADNRLRRNTDQVSSILNSLIAQGILVQTGDNTWTLDLSKVTPP